jgi:cobalamin synthase
MVAVPARVAGCREIVACTPPGPDGRPNDAVLAAAALVGVDALYAAGGAQAVALAVVATGTWATSRFVLRRIPGLTGDIYGGLCEIGETLVLLTFVAADTL